VDACTPSPGPAAEFPKAPGLTSTSPNSSVNTKYEDIPAEVLDLGKKSILDGFGLALAGSGSSMGPLVRQYVQSLGLGDVKASIIGTGMKALRALRRLPTRVSIHADDYDDTQLARAAKDRIYGLLTHPSVGVLPPTFAICELGRRTGKDLMLAYHIGVEVECKIAEAISPRHYDEGFHTNWHVWIVRQRRGLREVEGAERAANTVRRLVLSPPKAGGSE